MAKSLATPALFSEVADDVTCNGYGDCVSLLREPDAAFGEDSDLRRWGRKLGERGGKNAKKRAVVAVARKLAVLLHRLWVSGEVYEPLRNSQAAMRAVA